MPDYGMDYDWPAVSCVRRKHADFCETRIRRETGKIAKARDLMDRTPTGLSLLRGSVELDLSSRASRGRDAECFSILMLLPAALRVRRSTAGS